MRRESSRCDEEHGWRLWRAWVQGVQGCAPSSDKAHSLYTLHGRNTKARALRITERRRGNEGNRAAGSRDLAFGTAAHAEHMYGEPCNG